MSKIQRAVLLGDVVARVTIHAGPGDSANVQLLQANADTSGASVVYINVDEELSHEIARAFLAIALDLNGDPGRAVARAAQAAADADRAVERQKALAAERRKRVKARSE